MGAGGGARFDPKPSQEKDKNEEKRERKKMCSERELNHNPQITDPVLNSLG